MAKRIYISFNRRNVDTDADNDQQFLTTIRANVEHSGNTPVGEVLNDSMHVESVIKSCDEMWVCLRWHTDEFTNSPREELPGAFMCTERRIAQTLNVPIYTRNFIFKF